MFFSFFFFYTRAIFENKKKNPSKPGPRVMVVVNRYRRDGLCDCRDTNNRRDSVGATTVTTRTSKECFFFFLTIFDRFPPSFESVLCNRKTSEISRKSRVV